MDTAPSSPLETYFSLAQGPRTNSARAHYTERKTETQRASVSSPRSHKARKGVLPTSPGGDEAKQIQPLAGRGSTSRGRRERGPAGRNWIRFPGARASVPCLSLTPHLLGWDFEDRKALTPSSQEVDGGKLQEGSSDHWPAGHPRGPAQPGLPAVSPALSASPFPTFQPPAPCP